jgi:hypothetical protein
MRTRVLAVTAIVALAATLVLPATAASAKKVTSANLKALSNSINRAKHLTYSATYTTVSGGQSTTVTIAQKPPKSNFSSSSGGQIINNGKNTFYCSTTGSGSSGSNSGSSGSSGNSGTAGSAGNSGGATGPTTCFSVKGSNPLLGLENAFSPAVALGAFAQARQGLLLRTLGIKVSSSSATFAGQPSTCVTVNVRGQTAKYCVTKQGLLAYSGTPADHFQLTQYSSKPSASLFSVPAGASTQTLPGGGSHP